MWQQKNYCKILVQRQLQTTITTISKAPNVYRKHSFSSFVYTDGAKAMAMDCNADWLYDLVICHQLASKLWVEVFQVWQLQKEKETFYKVLATDANDHIIVTQQILFSDFP